MSPEQVVVQACHSVVEVRNLLPEGIEHPHLVLVGVRDESALKKAYDKIRPNVQCRAFHEADLDDQMTAFATEPVYGSTRDLFRQYQLLKMPSLQLEVLAD